jgi:Phage Mu protein F like protein
VIGGILGLLWRAAFALGWAAAIQILGVGGLQGGETALEDLLSQAGPRLDGIVETRIKRLEQALAVAADGGVSAGELAQQITAILGNTSMARLVTQTETSWGAGHAQVGAYRAFGVTSVIWQTMNDSLVCGRCRANQAAGPWPLGTAFPSGALSPPIHPRCRCWLRPAAERGVQ